MPHVVLDVDRLVDVLDTYFMMILPKHALCRILYAFMHAIGGEDCRPCSALGFACALFTKRWYLHESMRKGWKSHKLPFDDNARN